MKKPNLLRALPLAISLMANLMIVPAGLIRPALAAALPLVDDFETGLPAGVDGNAIAIGFNTFQDSNAATTVAISTVTAPPAPVPGSAAGNHVLQMTVNVVSYAGFTHGFENGAVNTWVTQDWSAYEGISFWLYGNNSGTSLFLDVLDNRNPGSTKDDAERWSITIPDNFSGWQLLKIPFANLVRKEIGNGAPNDGFGLTEVHGWALGTVTTASPQTYYVDDVSVYGVAPVRPLKVGLSTNEYKAVEGAAAVVTAKLSKPVTTTVTVNFATTSGPAIPNRDYTPVSGMLTFAPGVTQQSFNVQTIDDQKYQGERGVVVELSNPTGGASLGTPPSARVDILDNEPYDAALLDDFETPPYLWHADDSVTLSNPEIAAGAPLALPGQGAYENVLQATGKERGDGLQFGRTFPIAQDWSDASGLSFWYYGARTNRGVDVSLTNARGVITDSSKWKLVWSDEFDGKAGTAPDQQVWGRDLGDGTGIGNPGWGNSELETYTDGAANAATDGRGHLNITTKQADGSLNCYYGPCQYTSARLLTQKRFEVAYGRVEARIKIARGAGLWPAFWMLGTDIDQAPWPLSGEIDIMENVGRLPNKLFGTIHGPGYSGGASYGGTIDLAKPLADDYHVFAVEWQPNKITWLVDGAPYFTATPADAFLAGKRWVFNKPFFILMNVAVGGNFGGPVGADVTFPQTTSFDYVRVFQARQKSDTFQASFKDDFAGWRKITLPFGSFTGEDGHTLDLAGVTALNVTVRGPRTTPVMLDQIRLTCPMDTTVTNTADSGPGSLRAKLASVCVGGTVHFAPALAGGTITNVSALNLAKNVTVDGAGAPGLTVSGGGAVRVLEVNAGISATVRNLTLAKGYGYQLAGGVLNNGALTLDHVAVLSNTMATNAGDFWQGGGGIYNGGGSSLMLVDSTVAGNQARWSGGGIYSFFNTTTTIIRSTVSGNVSNDVGGGLRTLGIVKIDNSTVSGNQSTGWHGGALFGTDGSVDISNSTIANNIGPDWAPSAIFVGSFSAFVPSLKLTNSIVTGNHWYACEWHTAGSVIMTSGGHNVVQDASCNPVASDQIVGDAMVGPLANNGGPTLTHALLTGSPARDAADDAICPATDQRGVTRPQGPHCDVGSVEAP